MSEHRLEVKTHVGRDLKQSAQLFNSDRKVVWEYVSNGLQYVDPGVAPVVRVVVDSRKRRIAISDNGRGMDIGDLQNFFLMHGENLDRKQGRPGRGFFGTGKSAAFGIASVLRVTSVKSGHRTSVELTRDDIESDAARDCVPIRLLEDQVETQEPNGTRVEIEQVELKRFDEQGIISYIERHLAFWRGATVFVNNRLCEYVEPPSAKTWEFTPHDEYHLPLGEAVLVIKRAYAPLDAERRGIAIMSHNVVHEVTLGTAEGKEMSNYLFGYIDVPALDDDESTPSPFTMARSGELNRSNELVRRVFSFIDPLVNQVRLEVVEEARRARANEEARRLQQEADRLAQLINDDFDDFRSQLAKVRARGGGSTDAQLTGLQPGEGDDLLMGGQEPAVTSPSVGGPDPQGSEKQEHEPSLEPQSDGEPTGQSATEGGPTRARRRGGFSVEFAHMGVEERRAVYQPESRTIFVNVDHPQLVVARGHEESEDPTFLRLAYEVAFGEYAVALAQELNGRGVIWDVQDALFEIRAATNRLAHRWAEAYGA